jgi:glutathione reductase (NADPH)
MSSFDYDLVVLGGGSGGLAAAKRASSYGKKAAVIERARLGGTCVNVGCVPKKIMWVTASMAEMMKHDTAQYCFDQPAVNLNWPALKAKRDAYIVKLNGIYGNGLTNSNVASITGDATLVDKNTIQIVNQGETSTITASTIIIAVGGRPHLPEDTPGMEYCISSDGFFELEDLPKTVVVVGAGYIAVELAGQCFLLIDVFLCPLLIIFALMCQVSSMPWVLKPIWSSARAKL